jgi:hypothetical protein
VRVLLSFYVGTIGSGFGPRKSLEMSYFRRVCKTAESDYYLCHISRGVRPSVRLHETIPFLLEALS